MRRVLIACSTVLLAQGLAFAGHATRSLHDVAWINNGEGKGRILLRTGELSDLGPIVIDRAVIKVPVGGEGVERGLNLRVHSLTRDWNASAVDWHSGWSRPGGDFDARLYSRTQVDLSRGPRTVLIDVTLLLKEQVEAGVSAHGFLLTLDPEWGEGLDLADLGRFAALGQATLEVEYLRVSRPVSEFMRRDGPRERAGGAKKGIIGQ